METNHIILKMDLSYDPIDEGDRWAFYVKDLGITCYAGQKEQGPAVVEATVETLLDALKRDSQRIREYLDARGLVYRMEEVVAPAEEAIPATPSTIVREKEAIPATPSTIVRKEVELAAA